MLSSHSQKEKYFFKGLLFKAHYDFFSQQVASVQKEAFRFYNLQKLQITICFYQYATDKSKCFSVNCKIFLLIDFQ